MSQRPTHGVVIPYQELLAYAEVAKEMAKQDYQNGQHDDYGVHIPLWTTAEDDDGKSILENRGKQVRVYEDLDSQRERRREEPIEML